MDEERKIFYPIHCPVHADYKKSIFYKERETGL